MTDHQPAKAGVTESTAPAKAKPAPPWPSQHKVKELAELLDGMHADAQAIMKLDERLSVATSPANRNRIFQDAERVIDHFEAMGGRSFVSRLQKLWVGCYPESWWPEERDRPVYSEVAKMIAVLMGSFPTSKIPDPEIFVRVLLDDVMALAPRFVELESTCRALRKSKPFMPAISEVIKELETQQKLWSRRESTIDIIEGFYDDLCDEVANARGAAAATVPLIENRKDMPMAPVSSPDAVEVEHDDGVG